MGQHKESILIWCLAVQLFTSLVLGGLAAAGVVTGGIALQAQLPPSAWSAITDGITFWWSCLTFQVSGGGYIAGVFFWFLTIVEGLMLLLIIRGD
jgi:hypothetical protein